MLSGPVNTSVPTRYPEWVSKQATTAGAFPRRLSELRKQRGLAQAHLAERIGMHVGQSRRSEAGTSPPALDVIRGLSTALQVSADMLLFAWCAVYWKA